MKLGTWERNICLWLTVLGVAVAAEQGRASQNVHGCRQTRERLDEVESQVLLLLPSHMTRNLRHLEDLEDLGDLGNLGDVGEFAELGQILQESGPGGMKCRRRSPGRRRRRRSWHHRESVLSPLTLSGGMSGVTKDDLSRIDGQDRDWMDRTIDWLESPQTEMSIGVLSLTLYSLEIYNQIKKLGLAAALGQANWALVSIVVARFLKALCAVLKNTRNVLRYTFLVPRRPRLSLYSLRLGTKPSLEIITPLPVVLFLHDMSTVRLRAICRGYKTYALVKRGKNVFLRHMPDMDDGIDAP